MEGQVKIIDHYLCIEMPQEVDHHHAAKIREVADRLLLKEEVENIVFDFEKTNYQWSFQKWYQGLNLKNNMVYQKSFITILFF